MNLSFLLNLLLNTNYVDQEGIDPMRRQAICIYSLSLKPPFNLEFHWISMVSYKVKPNLAFLKYT